MRKVNIPVRVSPDFYNLMRKAKEEYGRRMGRRIRSDRELTQIWANNKRFNALFMPDLSKPFRRKK